MLASVFLVGTGLQDIQHDRERGHQPRQLHPHSQFLAQHAGSRAIGKKPARGLDGSPREEQAEQLQQYHGSLLRPAIRRSRRPVRLHRVAGAKEAPCSSLQGTNQRNWNKR